MKKLLTIFMLCFAVFAAKAQVTVTLEAHDVWGDGTGYQLLLDADANAFGTTIPATGPLTSSGDADAATYAEFEYKIPENADGALSTTNIVQDGSVSITILAGTYDYCITNPTPGSKMWIAGSENARKDDYVFQNGYIYHFTVIYDEETGGDSVILEVTPIPTDPTLIATPETLKFGAVIAGDTVVRAASITAYNLTAGITATTTAPFAVSLNDTAYATSVTMPAAGGTLYVKYTPTEAGIDSAIVAFASGDMTDTIVLAGRVFDCTTLEVPFVEDFDVYEGVLPVCYQFVYGNDDPTVNPILAGEDDDDNYVVAFNSMSRTDVYDQYMISPMMQYTGTNPLRLSVKAKNYYGTETFKLGYSTTIDSLNAFTWGDEETVYDDEVYETFSMVIPSNAKYVAIHYTSEYQYYLYIDSLSVEVITLPQITPATDNVAFGYVEVGNTSEDIILPVVGLLLDTTINAAITTTSPFEISINGVDYDTMATLPAAGDTLYVHYTPTAVGADTAVLMLTSLTELMDTVYVTLTGKGYECDNNLPYQTNFSDEAKNLCWSTVDANEDNYTFGFSTTGAYAAYSYNTNSNADDWLTSPAFNLTGAEYVAFDYKVYSVNYPEKFAVYIIGTDSTVILPEMEVTNTDYQTEMIDLSAYTGSYRIAFHCTSDTNKWRLYFTNFVIDSIANLESSLTVTPDTIDFGSSIFAHGMTLSETAMVTAVVVTDSLTVTTAAPFAVSLDGTNYVDSLIIPANDSVLSYSTTLYIQYAPDTFGVHTGTVIISGGSLTATIALFAETIDCSTAATLPFTEDFEDELTACWQNIDNDEDDFEWEFFYGEEELADVTHGGLGLAISRSYYSYYGYYNVALTPDNWMISPAIAIPAEGAHISWWIGAIDSNYYAEHYQVKVSTNPSDLSSFTNVYDETLTSSAWKERSVDIMQYAGQTIYIAFVHNNCTDMNMLLLDDINVAEGPGTGIEEETVENPVFIYPNPASTMLNVHAENYRTVQIVNFLGQVVYSANVTENDFQINVSNLSNGVYFIRLNGETTTTQKFIKR